MCTSGSEKRKKAAETAERCAEFMQMKCKYHQTAKELASNFVNCYGNLLTDIVHQVDHQSRSKLKDKARQILLPIAQPVLFCGRQGLELSGHDESNSILT